MGEKKMSFNLACYQNVIKEHISHYLIYNEDNTNDYSIVLKRSVYVDLVEDKVSFIHEIKKKIKELEEAKNLETTTDGSKGQWDYANQTKIQHLRDLVHELLDVERIKFIEAII